MTEERERRGVFGEATDAYEAGRPGYPADLVADVIEYAALDGARALEVGAGTGKATVSFAERGVAVTCVEPDARMAAVLSRNVAAWPQTEVVVSGLEQYGGLDGSYGLLYAAQSWHWVDPGQRWQLAHRALRPGGAIALFWNTNLLHPGALRDDLLAAHERHGITDPHTLALPDADGNRAGSPPPEGLPPEELFTDVTFPTYRSEHVFTAQRYVAYLDSISAYRILPDEQRTALLADVHRVVEAHGGSFAIDTGTLVIRGRRRG